MIKRENILALTKNIIAILFILISYNSYSQDIIKLQLIDSTNEVSIPLISISYQNIQYISDIDGKVSIPYLPSNLDDRNKISIKHISYKDTALYAHKLRKDSVNIILLKTQINHLQEVNIKPLSAKEYIQSVIQNIPYVYGDSTKYFSGIYTEQLHENEKLIYDTEGHIILKKSSYKNPKDHDLYHLKVGRRNTEVNPSIFSKYIQDSFGPYMLLMGDICKAAPIFSADLAKALEEYQFRYEPSIEFEGRSCRVIRFDMKDSIKLTDAPLFRGIIYIDKASHAISLFQYELTQKGIEQINNPGFTNKALLKLLGLGPELDHFQFECRYQYLDGKWYLHSAEMFADGKVDKRFKKMPYLMKGKATILIQPTEKADINFDFVSRKKNYIKLLTSSPRSTWKAVD